MIENFRTHPYTRAVCVETARLFERRAAKALVEAQCYADQGALDRAREPQASARLAQRRATAWHLRANTALAPNSAQRLHRELIASQKTVHPFETSPRTDSRIAMETKTRVEKPAARAIG
jgi:hypothetical protein